MRKLLVPLRFVVKGRPFRIGKIQIRTPFWVCLVWFLLFFFDSSGFLWVGVLTSLWHELGHIVCYLVLFRRFPELILSLSGIALSLQNEKVEDGQSILLAFCGPFANLLTAAVLTLLLQHRATILRAAFWAANLLIGGFNLLPIPPLDGYQILNGLWKFWANKLHFRLK